MNISALIPAYNPSEEFVDYVTRLARSEFEKIIVVNDGSRDGCDELFRQVGGISKVTVLKHAVNLGKGAALKTGLNYACCMASQSAGIVTIDADGQHLIEDAIEVAGKLIEHPASLVLGVRSFEDKHVPLRSKIGNILTKKIYQIVIGRKLTDTQTGLRGIPKKFIPHFLGITSNGYEFELDMLLCCKHSQLKVCEVPIETVYIENNLSSHFNPIFDSLNICFVLLRFLLSSLIAVWMELLIFFMFFASGSSIILGQFFARGVVLLFHYLSVGKLAFYSRQKHINIFPRYLFVIIVSGVLSYWMILTVISICSIQVLHAKIMTESLLFFVNFKIQRDYIFTAKHSC